jgi:molybdopterin molybdotransferase
MISVDEAWDRIRSAAQPLSSERRSLADALRSVLAEEVLAPVDLPPFDNSAMDGYALRAPDTQAACAERPVKLTVAGEVAAGGWQETPVAPGTAVKIMTGAAVPSGADAVLMLEAGRLRGDVVEIREPVPRGTHIRRRGEDVRRGDVLLTAGLRLNVQQLGLLANSGISTVSVHRAPRVSLAATGSELVTDGRALRPGQIYDSNRIVLRTLVQQTGSVCEDLGVAPDDPSAIAKCVREGLAADVLLVSGGVSVGAHDHVKEVLRDLSVDTLFWRVAMKPGKPILCGRRGATWVFGLPGNPISCVVGFLIFIEPLLRWLQGEAQASPHYGTARLTASVRKKDDRRHFMTARIEPSPDGGLEATPTAQQGSAMMHALAQANGFVVVPETCAELARGDRAQVLLFKESAR